MYHDDDKKEQNDFCSDSGVHPHQHSAAIRDFKVLPEVDLVSGPESVFAGPSTLAIQKCGPSILLFCAIVSYSTAVTLRQIDQL